jgi:hypothetical protein
MSRLARTFALAFALTLASCAPILRTNLMLKDYVGKPIDAFMSQRAFAADAVTPMNDGGAIYAFSGGPGGPRCRFFIVTDSKRIIKSYRFENC